MNEHIRRLAGQALDTAVPQTWTTLTAYDLNKFTEVFAELIVKECVTVVDGMADPDDSERYFWAIQNASQKIKQHFGVEE